MGPTGRLSQYFSFTRLTNSSNPASKAPAINRAVAADLLRYGHAQFSVILKDVQATESVTVPILQAIEQFWILLLPTYNGILAVGKYFASMITETQRLFKASNVYVYAVYNGQVVPGSIQVFPGIKYLIKNGLLTIEGSVLYVNPNALYACFNSGTLFHEQYLILREPLVNPED